jgi:hypothetical protein
VVELSVASMPKHRKGRERGSRLGTWGRSSARLEAASALARAALCRSYHRGKGGGSSRGEKWRGAWAALEHLGRLWGEGNGQGPKKQYNFLFIKKNSKTRIDLIKRGPSHAQQIPNKIWFSRI